MRWGNTKPFKRLSAQRTVLLFRKVISPPRSTLSTRGLKDNTYNFSVRLNASGPVGECAVGPVQMGGRDGRSCPKSETGTPDRSLEIMSSMASGQGGHLPGGGGGERGVSERSAAAPVA
jgi:hypothetical protein